MNLEKSVGLIEGRDEGEDSSSALFQLFDMIKSNLVALWMMISLK